MFGGQARACFSAAQFADGFGFSGGRATAFWLRGRSDGIKGPGGKERTGQPLRRATGHPGALCFSGSGWLRLPLLEGVALQTRPKSRPAQLLASCVTPPAPGCCGLDSESLLWCRGQAHGDGAAAAPGEPPCCACYCPLTKRTPMWGAGHPCILTQLSSCTSVNRLLGEGSGKQGCRAGSWNRWPLPRCLRPGEDFSAPPESTSCGPAWGNLVQQGTQSRDVPPSTLSLQPCLRAWLGSWALSFDVEAPGSHLQWLEGRGDDFRGLWAHSTSFCPSLIRALVSSEHPLRQGRVPFTVVPPLCSREPGPQQVCFSILFLWLHVHPTHH